MVNMFKRSLSFPNKIPSRAGAKPPMSLHTRSISLPCRSHPLLSQLKDQINELNTWLVEPKSRTSAWLCAGLSQLKQLHDSLADVLQLHQTQESLRRQPQSWVQKVLEDFLCYVDVYGIFQTSLMALREDLSAAHAAVRRKDEFKAGLYVKARKNFTKEIEIVVPNIYRGRVGRDAIPVLVGDGELVCVIDEAVEATKMVSGAVLSGIYTRRRYLCRWKKERVEGEIEEFRQVGEKSLRGLRKKGGEEVRMVSKKMGDLENCMVGIESGCERVFRGLINARVSMLNCLTH